MSRPHITGGCLCGAVRYEARAAPAAAGYCFCADCRKASGSGFIPFMNFPAEMLSITGRTVQFRSPSIRGTDAVRNSCPVCGGLVFGGVWGEDTEHTIYAGTLDDPGVFQPRIAIFGRDRPGWVEVPPE
ncbi:MAG: GFA family protein, partial [Proteobacteria bacterium]|nr:GFA family protein [Pseudomonadota bacterium]